MASLRRSVVRVFRESSNTPIPPASHPAGQGIYATPAMAVGEWSDDAQPWLRVHAAHPNVHQPDEFLIVIIEPLVRQELLQKCDELDRVVLIRLGEIDILQIEHEPLCVFRPEYPVGNPTCALRLAAALRQLLDDV